MPLTLNDTTITGLVSGGLLDSQIINNATIATNTISSTKLLYNSIRNNIGIARPQYQRLPSGLIIQSGNALNISAATTNFQSATITFPIAFPTTCAIVIQTLFSIDALSLNYIATTYVRDATASNFISHIKKNQTSGSFNSFYIALGY